MTDPGGAGTVLDAVRRVLNATAVLGEQAQVPYVAAVAGLPVEECVEALDRAVDAGLLPPGAVLETQAAAQVLAELSPAVLADLERRAGDEALRRQDFAAAGEHYAGALANPAGIDAAGRARLLYGAARAAFGAGLLQRARECRRAAREIAVRLGAPDLLAEGALALEPVGDPGWDAEVDRACADALAVPGLAEDLRVRVLARQTQAAVYAGRYDQAEESSGEALARAESTSDVDLLTEALNARQLARSGPDDVDGLLLLAERMSSVGASAGRADIEMWGRLWRVDAHAYRGDLPAVGRELAGLEDCSRRAATPYARWHLAVTRATLAVARAEFDEAEALLGEAYGIFSGIGHPAVHGARVAFGVLIGHHRGHRPELLAPEAWDFGTDPRWDFFSRLSRAFVLADEGELDEAATHYGRCGDLEGWTVPRNGRLVVWAFAARVATALRVDEDVVRLHERLAPYRGLFAAGGAGASNILGPVELTLGRCELARGRYDKAVDELTEAGRRSRAVGAVGFAVEADCLLVEALAGAGDPAAHQVARIAVPLARALGMHPWLARLEELAAHQTPDPLSVREREVAALVAEGLSNRAIAARLVISERTAQNHVQHILDKLGFASRAQIAAWVARR